MSLTRRSRYLIANAMQSYTSQPLAKQIQDNPFANSLLLATLIIPHLETYLAAHSETRFLILEYPAEHLSTVLALQRLVGVEILKVAGVLTAESPEPGSAPVSPTPNGKNSHKSIPSLSGVSISSSKTSATLISTRPGSRSAEAPSFSKANFLLTSSATDSEIATLISTIWKVLTDISPFYIPETAPRLATSRRSPSQISSDAAFGGSPLAAPGAEYAPFTSAKAMMAYQPAAAAAAAPTLDYSSTEMKTDQPAKCSAASIKSTRSRRTTNSTRIMLHKLLAQATAEAGDIDRLSLRPPTHSSIYDLSEDEESRFYQDERKYLPMFVKKQPELRRGNSRKALKFLGLA
jgi:hypothetical protein